MNIAWWCMLFMLVVVAILVVIVHYACRFEEWRDDIIHRCEQQHAAIMNGDERYGVHGDYPPVTLHDDLRAYTSKLNN